MSSLCPCRASLCTRFASDIRIKTFLRTHVPHTDGTVLEHITSDGERAVGPTPDRIVLLSDYLGTLVGS